MFFRVVCLCTLACLVAQAGSVTNSDGLMVAWNITGTTVVFTVTMPATLATNYQYWGIGFKSSDSGTDMVNANLWIVTKSGTFYDIWSTRNDMPSTSTLGTAKLISHSNSAGPYVTTISRNLVGASNLEQTFTQGTSYRLIYAYGTMTGTQMNQHSTSDSGGITMTLTNEYVATGTSGNSATVAVGLGTIATLWLAFH